MLMCQRKTKDRTGDGTAAIMGPAAEGDAAADEVTEVAEGVLAAFAMFATTLWESVAERELAIELKVG
jgi:hypothetical protein